MDFFNNNMYLGQAEIISREKQIRLPEWAKAENMEMCYSQSEIVKMINGVDDSARGYKRHKSAGSVIRAAVANELRHLANIISPEVQIG